MRLTHKQRRLMKRAKAEEVVREALTHRGFCYTEAEIFIKLLATPTNKKVAHKPVVKAIDIYV